jgi:hypothetical protein
MSLEFAKTPMGKRYYEVTLPALIESQTRLAKATEESNLIMASSNKQKERSLKLEHRKLLLEMKKMNLNETDLDKANGEG